MDAAMREKSLESNPGRPACNPLTILTFVNCETNLGFYRYIFFITSTFQTPTYAQFSMWLHFAISKKFNVQCIRIKSKRTFKILRSLNIVRQKVILNAYTNLSRKNN